MKQRTNSKIKCVMTKGQNRNSVLLKAKSKIRKEKNRSNSPRASTSSTPGISESSSLCSSLCQMLLSLLLSLFPSLLLSLSHAPLFVPLFVQCSSLCSRNFYMQEKRIQSNRVKKSLTQSQHLSQPQPVLLYPSWAPALRFHATHSIRCPHWLPPLPLLGEWVLLVLLVLRIHLKVPLLLCTIPLLRLGLGVLFGRQWSVFMRMSMGFFWLW